MVKDFVFDKVALSDLGYIAVFQSSEEQVVVSEMSLNTVKGARSDKSHATSYTYPNNYSDTFMILKNPCEYNDDEMDLTNKEISELIKWLCRKEYKWFRFVDDDDDDEIWYEVKFDAKKEYAGERVIGLSLTVEANTPYGFTKEKTRKYTASPMKIKVHSDEEGYIYPTVRITLRQGGNLVLTNTFENRSTTLKNCVNNETIVLYGDDLQQIVSSNPNHDYVTEFNYKFPRLCNKYNEYLNTFTSNLPCDISFTYREIRKVGME